MGHLLSVLVVAILIFIAVALAPRWPALARLVRAGGSASTVLVPRLLAFTTFLGGVILLFSGATPAKTGRIGWLNDVLPLPIIELSAYSESVAGIVLILLARGLQRRLDAAYHLTLWVLGGGIVVALASSLDVEQAAFLSVMFAALLPCRRYFYRRSSVLEERFTRGWFGAVGGVLAATAALAYIGYGRQLVSSGVFWDFTGQAQGPRAARGLTLVVVTLLALSVARLLRPARARPVRDVADLPAVEQIVAASRRANAHLALLGDKEFLLSESRTSFIMMGTSGECRIAMGDPVGPIEEAGSLVDRLITQCDREGSWPVFYRVGPQLLYLYLDYGLAVNKLGEVARVPLADFTLDGAKRRNLRRVWRKLVDAGCTFEVIPGAHAAAHMSVLREISNEWLAEKNAREKTFSLGHFDPVMIMRGPLALVRTGERIVAFATGWPAGAHAEVEVDLMRHVSDAPPGVMRYLLTEFMLWARAEGYAYFNLGMVPLSGIRTGTAAPVWNQLAAAIRIGGERYYNFQGLREFKAWFYPDWEPSYLVSPGGTRRPIAIANIAALISGGGAGVIRT